MVARALRLRQENGNSRQRQPENPKSPSLCAIPEQAAGTDCPEEVYLVTYNVDRQLQTHYYRPSREYTF